MLKSLLLFIRQRKISLTEKMYNTLIQIKAIPKLNNNPYSPSNKVYIIQENTGENFISNNNFFHQYSASLEPIDTTDFAISTDNWENYKENEDLTEISLNPEENKLNEITAKLLCSFKNQKYLYQ